MGWRATRWWDQQPEASEFTRKLDTEFGNSSSHPNFFGGCEFGDSISSYDGDHQKGSSSPSYSKDFDEEPLTPPNLLSII